MAVAMLVLAVLPAVVVIGVLVATSRRTWGSQGHLVRVPVDDFVVGDLPMVCARTGESADGLVGVQSHDGSFQAWWLLLLLLGPMGVIAIALLWLFAPAAGRVGGSVPMSAAALRDQNRAIGLANWAAAVPILGLVAGVAVLAAPVRSPDWLPVAHQALAVALLVVAFLGGFAVMIVSSTVANRRRVSVVLDGSRRWVEIRNVHHGFVVAVEQQVRARHRAGRDGARSDPSR